MNLKGKMAVVTGASEGIGKEICMKLAKEGVRLALVARSEEILKKVSKEAKRLGSPIVRVYPCDLRESSQIKITVKKIKSDFSNVNILINNAGIWQKLNPLEKLTELEVEDVVATNLTGMIHITRLLMTKLKKQKESAIINVSSRSGYSAQSGQVVYTATKYGVRGFTEVLKEDLKDTNIRVAGIYQGGVDTKMFKKVGDIFDQSHLIKPSDLAEVVVFMLSRPKQIWLHDIRVENK